MLGHDASAERMALLLGASRGFADFLMRHPAEVAVLQQVPMPPLGTEDARTVLLAALDDVDVPAARYLEAAASAIRVRYRRLLAGIAVYDLTRPDAIEAVDSVAAGLADLAGRDPRRRDRGGPPRDRASRGRAGRPRPVSRRGGRRDAARGHRHGQGRAPASSTT